MKVSFVVDNLGASQLNNSIIEFGNKYTQDEGRSLIVFFDQMHRHPQQLLFSTMNIVEAYNYGGLYITTSAVITKRALSFPCLKHILYYVYDFEWMRTQKPYQEWEEILCHPNVLLMARTNEYARIIGECFNRTIHYICDDLDYITTRDIINDIG